MKQISNIQENEIWIFLSHSNDDYETVRRVRNVLEAMHTRPLMFFLKCLNDTDEIEDLIKREIAARTRFILCDSPNARKSNWVSKEIEYIKELHKPFEIVDITADINTIKTSLIRFLRKERLYISYARELTPVIDVISKRLSKYDFCTYFIDKYTLNSGEHFITTINSNIDAALNFGKFIPILSKESIQRSNNLCIYELKRALKHKFYNDSILPVYLDKESKFHFHNLIHPLNYIDLSDAPSPESARPDSKEIPIKYGNLKSDKGLQLIGNDVVNAILVRLQGWGNLETYAEQFRFGIGISKDIIEADNLAKLIVEHWECVNDGAYFNGPGMLIRLAGLFREGRVVPKDMDKAKQYYVEAYDSYGIAIPSAYL